ncbi:tripartite tricarboxylate transporter substrate binding protein [Aquabacterium sp. J223]|uniref:Bug family tripartite tricarboxylate transporter substrate binding protein n=1 Tax=Aquabacterium sp. J223 TaxID=2898431 RepID=UPI0021AD9CE5|nr:tripartite tricarboxylate transporter substrate binding protein [Aquabacterium sp. J223]UUX94528.1 tripartite tricarboxylate transporter substrate binding protein [Aquabacterium sp. J223]
MRRFVRFLSVLWLLASAMAATAQAPSYPTRPVRIVIPYAAGGGADALSRQMSVALDRSLGQRFVVESRPGGNTSIAAVAVANAPADGHTLLMTGGTTMALQPLVQEKLAYDPMADFVPVSLLTTSPFMLVVSTELGVNSLDDLLKLARSQPGKLAYASNGIGGPVHLFMELLAQRAGVQLNHVPYKGFAPALPDLAAGRTPLTMIDSGSIESLVKAGKVKVLGITSPQRSPQFPDVPTVAEQGFPGYSAETWFALYAPAKTPPAVVGQLSEALRDWLGRTEAQDALRALGQNARWAAPEAVRQRILSEQQAYAPLVKAANIRAE